MLRDLYSCASSGKKIARGKPLSGKFKVFVPLVFGTCGPTLVTVAQDGTHGSFLRHLPPARAHWQSAIRVSHHPNGAVRDRVTLSLSILWPGHVLFDNWVCQSDGRFLSIWDLTVDNESNTSSYKGLWRVDDVPWFTNVPSLNCLYFETTPSWWSSKALDTAEYILNWTKDL